MPVIKLKYANKECSSLQVTTDTGEYSAPWPCHTWHAKEIQDAIDCGLTIDPYMTAAEALAQAQEALWGQIHAKRDTLILNGGVMVAVDGVNKWFYTTETARTQYSNLFAVFADHPDHTVAGWRTMDGSFVTMTKALLAAIQLNGVLQESAIFAVGVTHESAMMALATAEEVLGYDYTTDWPVTYTL